jgi:hypothetical protein
LANGAEIGQLPDTVAEQNVGRLHIAMHAPLLVQIRQRIGPTVR